jgi:hypothetical protein
MSRPQRRKSHGFRVRRASTTLQLERLAAACELTFDEGLQDWALVNDAGNVRDQDLYKHLRQRHAWDASVPPYYVRWLEGAKQSRLMVWGLGFRLGGVLRSANLRFYPCHVVDAS